MGAAFAAQSLMIIGLALIRFILGILLFTAPLPRRERFALRATITLVLLFCTDTALTVFLLGSSVTRSGTLFSVAQFATFSLLLIAFVAATIAVYDTSVWTALFCCSAGYTVQNLASGATEFAWSLIGGGSLQSGAYLSIERYGIGFVCMAVVYGATYLLITRYLLREGLGRIEDRSMLIMMAITILVIIGFDLLIKGLVEQGLSMSAMVMLRIFHGLACIFTLTMEFQLLITRRAEAERDVAEQILAERERQYEAARGNVTAINARMHDIRHSIARLADHEGMDKEVLREMVHEVSVYDTQVLTGNEALDTVLSERRFILEREGIMLSCVAEGAAFSFMAPADIYTLFSALIDGAVAAGGPSISLVVREALGTASAHLECYGDVSHGPWTETARIVIKRYGGTFSAFASDGTFHINVLFPAQ